MKRVTGRGGPDRRHDHVRHDAAEPRDPARGAGRAHRRARPRARAGVPVLPVPPGTRTRSVRTSWKTGQSASQTVLGSETVQSLNGARPLFQAVVFKFVSKHFLRHYWPRGPEVPGQVVGLAQLGLRGDPHGRGPRAHPRGPGDPHRREHAGAPLGSLATR